MSTTIQANEIVVSFTDPVVLISARGAGVVLLCVVALITSRKSLSKK